MYLFGARHCTEQGTFLDLCSDSNHVLFYSILGKIWSSVPLAVCSRVQGPAGWSRRPLFSNTQNFEAFSLRTTATVACQHRRVDTLSGRVCWGTSLQSHHRSFTEHINTTMFVAEMFLSLFCSCPSVFLCGYKTIISSCARKLREV